MTVECRLRETMVRRALLVMLAGGGCSPAGRSEDVDVPGTPWFTLASGDEPVPLRIDSAPAWSLRAGADGAGFVEPTDATELSDGTFVVADHRAGTLHYVSRSGQALRTVGGVGSGPGEFRSLEGVGLAGRDTVWAYDHSLRRLTIFDSLGRVLATHMLRPTGRPSWPSVLGVGSDGRAIVLERNMPLPIGQPGGAVWRDSSRLLWYSFASQSSSASYEVPLFDTYINPAGPQSGIAFIPFGPRLALAVSPTNKGVYVGFPEKFEVSIVTRPGTSTSVIKRAFVGRAVTEEDLRRRRAGSRPQRTTIPRSAIPARMPAFARLLADYRGGIWIQEYAASGEGARWASFDVRGVLRALAVVPRRFTLLLVSGDVLLGVQEDDDGAPALVLLRVRAG